MRASSSARPDRARLLRAALVGIVILVAATTSTPVDSKQHRLGAAVAPLRLVASRNSTIDLGGLNSYFDTVELDAANDGIVVSNRLPLERYVLGLNEVPTSWPEDALKAQAVAARTYALWTLESGRTGDAAIYGYDICATVQCQVFSGADVVRAEDGERWTAAVEATAGEAILYEGEPILARYHSTSGGRTINNEHAFPGEPTYPYLKSVTSPSEEGSPLFRWRVTFKIQEIRAMLARAGRWAGAERLVGVRSVGGPFYNPNVAFEGANGRRLVTTADEFRDIARDLAPAMFPGRYPSKWNTSSGVLPETLPSERYNVTTEADTVVFNGTGWGHGTGMSQWGAHGLAQSGASYVDILNHYYTGVSVGSYPDPGLIEVGVSQARSAVTASGSFKIVDGRGRTLVPRALGTWTFRFGGPGAVAIEPPRGYGLPLEVGIVDAPTKVLVGEPAYLTVALSRPAKVRTETAETPTGYDDPGVSIKEAGRRRVVWLAPLEEGVYRVHVQARAGPTSKRSESVKIRVTSTPVRDVSRDDRVAPRSDDEGANTLGPIALAVLVFALATWGLARVRRGGGTR